MAGLTVDARSGCGVGVGGGPGYGRRRSVCLDQELARPFSIARHQDEEPEASWCRCGACRCACCSFSSTILPMPLQRCAQDLEVQDCHQVGDQILPHRQEARSNSWELFCDPSSPSCLSSCCECRAYFVVNIYCHINCKGAGFGCHADAHRLEAACGVADCSAHAGKGLALILIFSAQLHASRRMCRCETHVLAVLEIFEQGLFTTILTPMLLPYHSQRCPRTLYLISYKGFSALQFYLSGCYNSCHLQAAVHDVFAIFTLGLIRRRRVRASSMSFLRFSGEDISDLSSVMHILDLQLNPSPQMRLPTRLLVEPLALGLTRLQEALEEYNCRFCASEFPPDLLIGSNCVLRLRHRAFSVAICHSVHVGTSSSNSVLQSTSCVLSYTVTVFLI